VARQEDDTQQPKISAPMAEEPQDSLHGCLMRCGPSIRREALRWYPRATAQLKAFCENLRKSCINGEKLQSFSALRCPPVYLANRQSDPP
jgi:hypothetical protein